MKRKLMTRKTIIRLPRALHSLTHVCVCVAAASLWPLPRVVPDEQPRNPAAAIVSEEEGDAVLRRAAVSALKGREGTILVMDAQTGRLRVVVNSRYAFEEALAPGSTIKPFTTLAALRAGVIDEESHLLCRQRYERGDFEINCSHPRSKPPFNPTQALAYSCNYYFSKLGEELSEATLNPTLASFGFGARTAIDAAGGGREAQGALPRGAWHVRNALGEGNGLLVTPVQLITAYAALVNGGHLFVPQHAPAQGFERRERDTLDIAPEHHALLLKGMRGAVAYGTAARAKLNSLPLYVFGKTGTSTPAEDFRVMDGWFVGFAADRNEGEDATPDKVRLAVVVFLKRANGAESAELARPVFEAYAQTEGRRDGGTRRHKENATIYASPRLPISASSVRVHMVREDATVMLALDDYIFGVMAAEASVEDEYEALKAQAVTSRTYALKNLGRHARDGYDFCNSTHCQRYINVRDESARADFYDLLRRAIGETASEVLRDRQGRIADAYFSAACGGATANITTLWGVSAPGHLRGVRDDYCAAMPYRSWTDTITAVQLTKALRSDPRSDVGARLDNIRVTKRDATGRAEMIALEGERSRTLRGWDFKIIVGRSLGWNVLKSSRFEVRRAGNDFVFRGSGFGHGLGLCQLGAHVMAERGASYRQILNQYFPGAGVSSGGAESTRRGDTGVRRHVDTVKRQSEGAGTVGRAGMRRTDVLMQGIVRRASPAQVLADDVTLHHRVAARPRLHVSASPRLTLSSEHFRADYPARVARRDVEIALRTLEDARADVSRRLAAASVHYGEPAAKLDLFIHQTTGDFVAATGQPSWTAAATRGRRIELQPVAVLLRRGLLFTTLRHEYAHVVIEALGRGRAPRWLAEGLAAHMAGEGPMLARFVGKANGSLDEIERKIARPASMQEMRALYAAAYAEVSSLIRKEGEAGVWRRVARS